MSLEEGARTLVTVCMAVEEDEGVLVVGDGPTHGVAHAIFEATQAITPQVILAEIPTRTKAGEEPPAPLASMMVDCDAIFLVASQSMTHTQARRSACRGGARVISIPGATEDMLAEGALGADYREVEEAVRRVHRRLRRAQEVHLRSELGTDLTFSIKGREWIAEDTGICHHRGECTSLPAGEIFIAPVEGSAEGKLVLDALFGGSETTPVRVTLREGYATRIQGADAAVKIMNRGGLDGRNFALFGCGLNPRARIIGNPLEDTKALGSLHVIFGGNTAFGGRTGVDVRVEGVLRAATVEVDGKVVVEHGKLRI